MFKLDLEKAEEPEIKLPTSTGSYKKLDNFRKTSISASLTMLKPLTVWIATNFGKLLKKWEYQIYLPPEKPVCRSRTTVRTEHGVVQICERSVSRLYIVTLLI